MQQQQPTPQAVPHVPGERRRTVALASLVTLVIYFAWEGIAAIPHSAFAQHFADLLAQPLVVQAALLTPIWLGVFFIALAQRQLIAQKEGAYGALLAISQVRGMRGPGLVLGFALLVGLVAGAIFNVLANSLIIAGGLAALYLFALGLPDAPAARYAYHATNVAYIDVPAPKELPPASAPYPNTYLDSGR
jgi:hypothetical protein